MDLQRNEAWHSDRCGIITASRIKDVLAVSKRDGKPLRETADGMAIFQNAAKYFEVAKRKTA